MRLTKEGRGRLVSEIRAYAAEGRTRQDIAELTSKSYSYVSYLANKHGIQIKDAWGGTKRRPEIDMLLTGQYTLEQIAERTKPVQRPDKGHERVTRQNIHQYVERTGQRESFKLNRRKFREHRKSEYQYSATALVDLLKQHLQNKLENESFPVQLAVEYDQQRQFRVSNIPIENIAKLIKAYEGAIETGRILSLGQLSSKCGISYIGISKILKILDIKPLTDFFRGRERKKRQATPKFKKEAMSRAYKTKYSTKDIAYFLGLPYYVVEGNYRCWFGPIGEREKGIKQFGLTKPRFLTYRAASQMYQAQDWGWSEEEVVYCFDGRQKMVRYALEYRTEIESKINRLLDLLYPDVKHDKPYLSRSPAALT